MVEKYVLDETCVPDLFVLLKKINELVDAVNGVEIEIVELRERFEGLLHRAEQSLDTLVLSEKW